MPGCSVETVGFVITLKLTLVVVLCDMIGCCVETVGFVKAHTCSCFV